MAQIYLTFDFGNDEEKAQQARHKLDTWKQAFKLDKKMLYQFDRKEDGVAPVEAAPKEKSAKAAESKGAKGKAKTDPAPAKLAASKADIKLILRLALPNHERLTEQRLLKRFPAEEPFKSALPKTIHEKDLGFADVAAQFEELERHGAGFQRPS